VVIRRGRGAMSGTGATRATTPVDSGHAAAGIGRRPRAALLTLGLLSAFGPISLDLYLPALPLIGFDLRASDASTQLTLSAALGGLALGQLIVGPLSDRVGRRRPLLVGLAGFAVMSIACALAPGIHALIATRLGQGLCGAAGLVVARAVVRDAFPDDRIARVFSLLMLINGLAPVLAPLLGGVLLHVMSWRGLFWVLALIGAGIGVLTTAALPETLPPDRRHRGGLRFLAAAVHEVSRDRLFGGATAVLALTSAALFTYISLSSFVLQSAFGLSPSEFSAVFAINSVGIVIGGRVSGLLLRRFDSFALLGGGLGTMTAATAMLLLAAVSGWGLPGLLPPLFVAIGTVGVVLPNATALALRRHARSAGTASALLGSMQYLAGALAGPLVSARGASATAMAAGMTATIGTGLLVWTIVLRPVRRELHGPPPSAAEIVEEIWP
jgi:DHA1 family bicyclomycin/chloramphenicol resistance-like MFS transporter